MWFIQRITDNKIIYLLNKVYTVGRKEDSIIFLKGDVSVSRKHCELEVDYSKFCETGEAFLKVKDLGSTYGVFVSAANEKPQKIQPKEWFTLEGGSSVHFGQINHWIVKWHTILITCSAVSTQSRKNLNEVLLKLGGRQIPKWQEDITHVVVDADVKATEKSIFGLLAAKPIVLAEYFEKWVSALDENPESNPPNIKEFLPSIDDKTLLVSDKQLLLPNEERKSIFKGKTFLFPSPEQYKSMAGTVEKAGGKATMEFSNCDDNTIVVELSSGSKSEEYLRRVKDLTSRGKRPIAMKEILHALFSSSTQRYCNPSFNALQLFGKKTGTTVISERSFIVPESQSICELTPNREPPTKKTRIEMTPEHDTSQQHFNLESAVLDDCFGTTSQAPIEFELKRKKPELSDDTLVATQPTFLAPEPVATSNGNKQKRKKLMEDLMEDPVSSVQENEKPDKELGNKSKKAKLIQDSTLEPNRKPPVEVSKQVHEPSAASEVINRTRDVPFNRTSRLDDSRWCARNLSKTFSDSTISERLSKMAVRSTLHRSDITLISKKTKKPESIERMVKMKIASRKEGRWMC